MEPFNLETATVMEIKGFVYDQMALLEQCQKNIQVANQAIAQKSQPVKPVEKKEESYETTPA